MNLLERMGLTDFGILPGVLNGIWSNFIDSNVLEIIVLLLVIWLIRHLVYRFLGDRLFRVSWYKRHEILFFGLIVQLSILSGTAERTLNVGLVPFLLFAQLKGGVLLLVLCLWAGLNLLLSSAHTAKIVERKDITSIPLLKAMLCEAMGNQLSDNAEREAARMDYVSGMQMNEQKIRRQKAIIYFFLFLIVASLYLSILHRTLWILFVLLWVAQEAHVVYEWISYKRAMRIWERRINV